LQVSVSIFSPVHGHPSASDKHVRVLFVVPHVLHVPWHEPHSPHVLHTPPSKQQLANEVGVEGSEAGKGPQIIEPFDDIALNVPQQELRGNLHGDVPQYSYLVLLPVQGHPCASVKHVRVLVT
jgi:hypothetical protein